MLRFDHPRRAITEEGRIPGTINIPDAGKAKQGRTPALATIPTEFISDKHYALDDLADWAPPTPEKAKPDDGPKSPIDWDAVEADTYDELPAELIEKFAALRKQHPDVDKLWGGVPLPRQKDESPSGFEYALAGELKRASNFTSTEFAQVRKVWDQKSEKHADNRRSMQRVWDRASGAGAVGFRDCAAANTWSANQTRNAELRP